MNLRKNNIVILGMTGVGKTTIGKILSKILKFKFIDIDYEIEMASDLKVHDFFEKYGEKEFRELERKILLRSLQKKDNTIISTGAGILSEKKIISEIKKKSISIFLDISMSNLLNRLKHNTRNRPKLRGDLKKNLENMYKNRITNYNQADIKISVNNLTAGDIVSRIIKKLNYEKI